MPDPKKKRKVIKNYVKDAKPKQVVKTKMGQKRRLNTLSKKRRSALEINQDKKY